MAPEQAMGESARVDAQTGLWAVAATLSVLASGEPVHDALSAWQLTVHAGTKKAQALASVAEDGPKPVAEVIDKAPAFDKAERWATAAEMRAALQRA